MQGQANHFNRYAPERSKYLVLLESIKDRKRVVSSTTSHLYRQLFTTPNLSISN